MTVVLAEAGKPECVPVSAEGSECSERGSRKDFFRSRLRVDTMSLPSLAVGQSKPPGQPIMMGGAAKDGGWFCDLPCGEAEVLRHEAACPGHTGGMGTRPVLF